MALLGSDVLRATAFCQENIGESGSVLARNCQGIIGKNCAQDHIMIIRDRNVI